MLVSAPLNQRLALFQFLLQQFGFNTIISKTMKIFILGLTIFPILLFAQDTMNIISIIPKPLSIKQCEGSFSLNDSTKIIIGNNPRQLKPIAEHLASRLHTVTGYPFELVTSSKKKDNSIILILDEKLKHLGKEGYQLIVTEKSVTIKSTSPTGIFYGVQSLYQLLLGWCHKGSLRFHPREGR